LTIGKQRGSPIVLLQVRYYVVMPMIERGNKLQMSLKMPPEMGHKIEEIVEQDEEMSEARFAREAMRRELQRYEQEGYDD